MKKAIVAEFIRPYLDQEKSFLDRSDIELFTASSNEEALKIHRRVRADLIITVLGLSGLVTEQFCSLIREDRGLRAVSVIVFSPNFPADLDRAAKCKANAVMTLPVRGKTLLEKAQELLNVSPRESYRVLFSVQLQGRGAGAPFYCASENISATGMLIETDRELNPGDRLECSFSLPGAPRMAVNGEIVRVIRKAKADVTWYGMKFSSVAPEAQRAIEDFIEKRGRTKGPRSSRDGPFS